MTEKRRIGSWIESGYLGHGTFGMVQLWCNEKTKERIALKMCRNDPPMKPKNQDRWRQEVEFLKRINHPNIITTLPLPEELAQDELIARADLPPLCMEYCEGGDLRKTLSTLENCCGLKEAMIVRVCEDIASAIECLHKENIAHRDLKPENIVICPSKNKNIYKVIDLGYAKEADQSGLWHSFVGTHYYLAPEILSQKKYTLTVDLWSFGILLYECCTGVRPFPANCQKILNILPSCERDIIAVKEETDDMLVYCDKLPEVNRLNCVLEHKFEKLLRLLLDINPSRRGSCEIENGKRHWNDCIRDIQNTKVIEVFSIDLYKKFVYELTPDLSVNELKRRIEMDTEIVTCNQELFIHDGSDLSIIDPSNSNTTAFMFNQDFNPDVELRYRHELPRTLLIMLEDPEGFLKRPIRCHMEVYKHSVFFIHKQITNNLYLIRGLKALVIRLLKWCREEFTVRSERVGQKMTELKSVVVFFRQSLQTDLKIYETKFPSIRKGIAGKIIDFEAWKRVEKEMSIDELLKEENYIFRTRNELQAKIASIKNNERVSKTPERSMQQLKRRADEIVSRYEQMKMSFKKLDDNSSTWKDKIGILRDTIKMTLKEVEKINEEFYQFLRQLVDLRKELDTFIPKLNLLDSNISQLRGRIQEWQFTRQEQIWQLLSVFTQNDGKELNESSGSESRQFFNRKRRMSAADLVKESQTHLSRLKDSLHVFQNKHESWQHQIENLDWSFCSIYNASGDAKSTENENN